MAPVQRHVYIVYVALFGMNLLDLLYSDSAFSMGGQEANPLMNFLYMEYGMRGIAAFKGFVLAIIFCFLHLLPKYPVARFSFYGATVAYYGLTLYHIVWYQSIKHGWDSLLI